jgi:hypothetical protein
MSSHKIIIFVQKRILRDCYRKGNVSMLTGKQFMSFFKLDSPFFQSTLAYENDYIANYNLSILENTLRNIENHSILSNPDICDNYIGG